MVKLLDTFLFEKTFCARIKLSQKDDTYGKLTGFVTGGGGGWGGAFSLGGGLKKNSENIFT